MALSSGATFAPAATNSKAAHSQAQAALQIAPVPLLGHGQGSGHVPAISNVSTAVASSSQQQQQQSGSKLLVNKALSAVASGKRVGTNSTQTG